MKNKQSGRMYGNLRKKIIAAAVFIVVLAAFPVFGATPIYRSVGPGNTLPLAAGTGMLMISGSNAVFAAAMPLIVGVGDAIQYDSNNDSVIDSIAFITSRIDPSHYTVQNAAGGLPVPMISANTSWGIFRAYTALAFARTGGENFGINAAVRNFDTWSGGRAAVANSEQWNFACYADAADAESTDFVWNGWTTSAVNYIRIYTPYLPNEVGLSQRHNGTYTNSGYRIEDTGGNCLILQNDYMRVEGLQFRLLNATTADTNCLWIQNSAAASDFRVSDCVFYGITTTTYAACDGIELILAGTGGTVKIWNNIFYNFGQPLSAAIDLNDSSMSSYVYNNTIAYCTSGISAVSGNVTAINNLVQNCGTANFSGPAFNGASDYNVSSLLDAPGVHSRQGATAAFAGFNDYHLAPGDTAAIGHGTSLALDANIPFNDDIDRDIRAGAWDIGADQNVIISVATPTPLPTALPNAGQNWYAANYCAATGPMYGANAFVLNDRMWVEGFWDGTGPANSIYFSSDGYIWDTPGSAPWTGRYNAGMAVLNNTVYMIGGEGLFGLTNEVWASSDGISWNIVTGTPGFSPRTQCRALVYNGNLWVLGGQDASGNLQDAWFSADGLTWNNATSSAPWGKRNGEAAVVFNGYMWVIGGYSDGAADYTKDAWYSSDGANWIPATTTAGFSKRSPGGAMAYGGRMYITGGWDGSGALGDVWSSATGAVWSQETASAEFGPRKGQADLLFNDQMWVIGGGNGPLTAGCDVWYSPPNGTMTPAPTPTSSKTPTVTPTRTVSATISPTYTVSATFTALPTGTNTPVIGPGYVYDGFVTNGPVYSVLEYAGAIYIGGSFTIVGPRTGEFVPIDQATGNRVVNWPQVAGGVVNTAAPDGAGGWYIGGTFLYVSGQPRTRLAHILANGQLDSVWVPGCANAVNSIVVIGNTVYIGGGFAFVNGSGAGNTMRVDLAAFDGVTGALLPWNPAANNGVRCLTASGNTIYIGGDFTTMNSGTTRNHICAVDATTGLLTSFDPDCSGSVYTIVISGNALYAGGAFTTFKAGTVTRNNMASFDLPSDTPNAWDPWMNNTVEGIAVDSGVVYAVGFFTAANNGTVPRNYAAAFNTGSSVPTSWNPNLNASANVVCVSAGTVYMGGTFTSMNGSQLRFFLGAVDTAGGAATSWNPYPNGYVYTVSVSGGLIYAGGGFNSVNSGNFRSSLAALDATTYSVLPWNPGASDIVFALAQKAGIIYAGGQFVLAGGSGRNHAAAFDAALGALQPWNPGTNGLIRSLVASGSTIYAGGDFTTVNGATARNRLAAFDDVNGTATGWDPNIGNSVYSLALQGSTLFCGGTFTTVNGSTTRNHAAALDTTSGTALAWDPNFNNDVYSIMLSGTELYTGGNFTTVNGSTARNYAADVDVSSGTALPWNPNCSAAVYALAGKGSAVYMGGNFATVNGSTARAYIAAVDPYAGTVLSWNPVLNSTVRALFPSLAGNRIYAGGLFYLVNNLPASYFAAFEGAVEAAYTPSATASDTLTQTPTKTRTMTFTATPSPSATASVSPMVTPTYTQTCGALPFSTITYPLNSANYNPADISQIAGIGVAPCGTVTAVGVSIKDNSSGKYWDGSSWSSVVELWNPAVISGIWQYSTLPPWQPGDSYSVRSAAQDDSFRVETPNSGIMFSINTFTPSPAASASMTFTVTRTPTFTATPTGTAAALVLNLSQYKSVSSCAQCGDNITYTINYALIPKPPAGLAGAIYSPPATKLVGAGQAYSTIGSALNSAVPGDVIEVVDSGVYEEHVDFPDTGDTAGIILRAKPGQHPVIAAPDSVAGNDLIDISFNCTIAGFIIDGRFIALHGICQNTAYSGYKIDRCFVKNCRGIGINMWVIGYSGAPTATYPSTYITNCVLANNNFNGNGNGIQLEQGEAHPGMTVNIWNCTVYGNQYGIYVNGPAYPYDIRNCIMRGNINQYSGDKSMVSYSIIEEPAAGYGPGCINIDPLFAGSATGNFHLLPGSQAIDSGDAGVSAEVIYDMDLGIRPVSGIYDMGAYEYDAINCVNSVSNVSVWDTLPPALNLVSGSAGYTVNGAVISWMIPNLCENEFIGSRYFIAAPAAACPVLTPVSFGNIAYANYPANLTPVPANPEFVSLCVATPTYTQTATNTATCTGTPSLSGTTTMSPTDTVTLSITPTATFTATNTPSGTPTFSCTMTWTAVSTHSFTPTPTYTTTGSATQTVTQTITDTISSNTPTATPTFTASPTCTSTSTATPSATPSYTPTNTGSFTRTATGTGTRTPTFTITASPTVTNTPVNPSVAVAAGPANPAGGAHIPGDSNVSVMQFSVHNTGTETISFTSVTLSASGTGNDQTGISGVVLYRDNNGDGALDGGDTGMKSSGYLADNGTAVMSGISGELIPPGETRNYIIVYSFAPSAPLGTYTLAIPGSSSIGGTGQTTGLAWDTTASLWPVDGAAITLVAPTATVTRTLTGTRTITQTSTQTFTATPSFTQTGTQTSTYTGTATPSASATASGTPTFTPTSSPTASATPTYTNTNSPTVTGTYTATPTATGSYTATATSTQPPTNTITPTFTITQTLTPLPTPNNDRVLDKNYADKSKGEVINVKVNAAAANSLVKVKIYNLTGERIRDFSFITGASAGWYQAPWDLRNNAGKPVGQGIYFVHIEAEGRAVMRKVFILK